MGGRGKGTERKKRKREAGRGGKKGREKRMHEAV